MDTSSLSGALELHALWVGSARSDECAAELHVG
jgi:hypothetical protein